MSIVWVRGWAKLQSREQGLDIFHRAKRFIEYPWKVLNEVWTMTSLRGSLSAYCVCLSRWWCGRERRWFRNMATLAAYSSESPHIPSDKTWTPSKHRVHTPTLVNTTPHHWQSHATLSLVILDMDMNQLSMFIDLIKHLRFNSAPPLLLSEHHSDSATTPYCLL